MARDYRIRDNNDGSLSVIVTVPGRPPKTVPKRFKTVHAAKNYITRVRAKATGRLHPLNALGAQRRATILARLVEAAETGEPMPPNGVLAALVGLAGGGYKTALSKHLSALERAGLIKIARGTNASERRVTICATGKRTGWQVTREYKPKKPPPKPGVPGAYTFNRSLSGGYSDTFLYGALTDAVRACRRRGDVVYRDPRNSAVILINGRPGDPKERAAWHANKSLGSWTTAQVVPATHKVHGAGL